MHQYNHGQCSRRLFSPKVSWLFLVFSLLMEGWRFRLERSSGMLSIRFFSQKYRQGSGLGGQVGLKKNGMSFTQGSKVLSLFYSSRGVGNPRSRINNPLRPVSLSSFRVQGSRALFPYNSSYILLVLFIPFNVFLGVSGRMGGFIRNFELRC